MRRLSLLLLLTIPSVTLAQEKLTVLKPAKGDPPNDKLLYQHLVAQAQKHFDARRHEIAALKTPADFRKRQARLKRQFLTAIGGLPKKTPLKARVTGKIAKDDYRIEKVIYESRPNHHVTAILYVPTKGKGPFPGVLVPCGHSKNGKAAEAYQLACILMVKNGFVVLCYDPIGQGERNQLLNKLDRPAIPSSTSEHTMVGVGALLVGKSAATYRIWDGIRSLDYLAGRPEVDETRLGCTGNSGGGTMTAYLMALDERIVCAAPSCYITSLERLFKTIGPQDAEQNITGQVAFGMEHSDYLTLRAPKPTLVLVGTQDFFDIDGAWRSFREAKLMYGLLGYGERMSLFEYNDGHGFSKPRRQAAVRWMRRWLLKKDDAIVEPTFPIFTDAQLQCTRSGQVLADFRGTSAFHVNAQREKILAKQRPLWQAKQSKTQWKNKIRELLGVRKRKQKLRMKIVWERSKKDHDITASLLTPPDGIPLPVLRLTPKTGATDSLAIVVSDRGAATEVTGETVRKLLAEKYIVLAVDLRGMGETTPNRSGRGLAKYFGNEWQETFLGLHLNRPLLGQRVQDLIALLDVEAPSFTKRTIQVIGIGNAGPVALHAAVLDTRITKVTVQNSLRSWCDVVHTPMSKHQLANVVPGVLAYYDLPDLVRLLGRDRVTVRDAVDPMGKKLVP